jgi:predicted nuclease of restriction endonuclease-like (RecB) superfamily
MQNELANNIEKLYGRITHILDYARNTVYKTANFEMVKVYWEIGREIVEQEQQGENRAEYGISLIKELSGKLSGVYGKGFNETNLKYMRQFYQAFKNSHALRGELTWTHYRLLLKVEKEPAREYYIRETIEGNWSTRTLERQINSMYYERILMSGKEFSPAVKKEAESKKEVMLPQHIIKDPYVLEFLDLKPNKAFYEKELEQGLIEKLQEFIMELGKGFSFVRRQYRISAEDEHFYVDLVFYNYILKCFLLIDLKTGKLTHQDIGQMDMYVRYFEDKVKQLDDNPTIGLILCLEKNKALAKYSLLNDSKQIFASKYMLYLPSEETLRNEIERERAIVELEKRLKE